MDDTTTALLARFERRMANAQRLLDRAAVQRSLADDIERDVDLPDHQRPAGDETTQRLEIRLLRQKADELTRDAEGIVARLYEAPKVRLTDEIRERLARFERGARGLGDIER